jgi:hypothetical protein
VCGTDVYTCTGTTRVQMYCVCSTHVVYTYIRFIHVHVRLIVLTYCLLKIHVINIVLFRVCMRASTFLWWSKNWSELPISQSQFFLFCFLFCQSFVVKKVQVLFTYVLVYRYPGTCITFVVTLCTFYLFASFKKRMFKSWWSS